MNPFTNTTKAMHFLFRKVAKGRNPSPASFPASVPSTCLIRASI